MGGGGKCSYSCDVNIDCMKKYLIILLLSVASNLHAQSDDFKAFRERMLSDYSDFRKGIMEQYEEFLDAAWAEY